MNPKWKQLEGEQQQLDLQGMNLERKQLEGEQ
jgi:hypothetical protein